MLQLVPKLKLSLNKVLRTTLLKMIPKLIMIRNQITLTADNLLFDEARLTYSQITNN
jgi:hypothetical protein